MGLLKHTYRYGSNWISSPSLKLQQKIFGELLTGWFYPSWFYLSGTCSPGWTWTNSKRAVKRLCVCVCVLKAVCRQGSLALAGSLSRRRKTLIQNRGWWSPLASPCDGRTHQSSRIFRAIGFLVRSLETWDDGAQRLLTLKTSLRRLGGQPAVGASAQSVVLTASHSSFIEVPSTGV